MKFKFFNKKLIISFIVLIFLIGGFLLWVSLSEYPELTLEPISKNDVLDGNTYEITTDDLGQKFIEHKQEGLRVKVPDGWITKENYMGVDVLSPDVEFNEYGSTLESARKGTCGVAIVIKKSEKVDPEVETDAELVQLMIIRAQQDPKSIEEGDEAIEIDGRLGLKRTIWKKDGEIGNISVEIPIDDTVYSFDSGIIFDKKCIDSFEKFIETISIDK